MPVKAVVGLQYGDEGKGRTTDAMAGDSDLVVRFQGGPNAGHRVINRHGRFDLHQVPSGVFYDRVKCLAGTGMVIDPSKMVDEIAMLTDKGVECANVWISDRAHLILPHHVLEDMVREKARGEERLGTTLSGVGTCYADKANRDGVQIGEMLYRLERDGDDSVTGWIKNRVLEVCARYVTEDSNETDRSDALSAVDRYVNAVRELGPRVIDARAMVREALSAGERILLEGQLGGMRDLDWGIYPFVTSSNPTPAGALVGAGIPVSTRVEVVGVAKAYLTSVGEGPMPTELFDGAARHMWERGEEYGVTTGRPRRCGWFDAVAARQVAEDSGVSQMVLTKLDVLSGLDRLAICVEYELDGQAISVVPPAYRYQSVRPVYRYFDGWDGDLSRTRQFERLPQAARRYVESVEQLVGVSIAAVSVGPERDQIIIR